VSQEHREKKDAGVGVLRGDEIKECTVLKARLKEGKQERVGESAQ